MKTISQFAWSFFFVLLTSEIAICADTNLQKRLFLSQPTPAYKKAALKLMLAEANEYAARLHLPEKLPMTKDSLVDSYISSPEFADRYGGLGRFSTTNYSYGFGRGKRLAYITRVPKDKSGKSLYDKFKPWAIDPSAVNTNAAYLLATQFLAQAFVDLPRLSNSAVSIRPIVILHMTTSVYDLEWKRGGKNVVEIGFDEPTKELWLLRVEDPDYILREPLQITNSDYLLLPTNVRPD